MAHLPEVDPALAALALWCATEDGDGAETVTSGDVIRVGTAFPGLPLQEQIGLIGRHVLHVALRREFAMASSATRFGSDFDEALYNICATAFANECLLQGGHALPRPALRLGDLLQEALPEEPRAPLSMLAVWDSDRLYHRVRSAAPEVLSRVKAFAEATGFAPDILPDAPDPFTDRKAAGWRAQLIRASRAGGGSGRGIGSALRRLSDLPMGGIPWERRLRGLMARALSPLPRKNFRRPRSAWLAREADAVAHDRPRPAFEPAEMRPSLRPRIVIGLDSSGSITPETLRLFAGEVIGIMRRTAAETHVLCFDELVYAHRRLEAGATHAVFGDLDLRRDGGTSFEDFMAKAAALSPSVIVVLSDLAGAFGRPPSCRVIWASPVPPPIRPPYGEVLLLTGERVI